MKWSELDDETKAILEWLEGPHTDKRHTIVLRVGERPWIDGRRIRDLALPVSDAIFAEVRAFAIESDPDKELALMLKDDEITLRIGQMRPQDPLPVQTYGL